MSSDSYYVYCIEIKVLLQNVADASGALNKANVTKVVFNFILNNKDVLRNELTDNVSCTRKNAICRFYEAMVNKSFEIRNSLHQYNINDDEHYELCNKIYDFAKGDLIKYFNYSEDNALFHQSMPIKVRRSARIAAKQNHVSAIKPGNAYPYPSAQSENIVLYDNPYNKVPELRRSARIAARTAKV